MSFFRLDELDDADPSLVKVISSHGYSGGNIPKQVFSFIDLQRLEMKYGELVEIPDEISRLQKLKELYLLSNKIERISNQVSLLTRLKKLRIEDNRISDILPICTIPNLLELQIGRNNIHIIPREIGNLQKLKSLDLGNIFYSNPIEHLSDRLGELENLEQLSIHGANLSTLNDSIGELVNLKSLSVRNSNVKMIGFGFDKLKGLEVLDLTNNQISTIGRDLSEANNLISIYFNNNPIKEIPESILNLPKIETIGIAGSEIPQTVIAGLKIRYPHITFIVEKDYFTEIFSAKKRVE